MKPYITKNVYVFFARFVSPMILKNRIVSRVMTTLFDMLEKFNIKIDKVTNEDI